VRFNGDNCISGFPIIHRVAIFDRLVCPYPHTQDIKPNDEPRGQVSSMLSRFDMWRYAVICRNI
jgi:hypothetical protein